MKRLLLLLLLLAMIMPGAVAEQSGEGAGYAMLSTLYEQNGQFACSPLSLNLALSMAAEGAEGETKAQLLGYLGAGSLPEPDTYKELKSANAAIVSDKIQFLDTFEALLRDKYRADIFPMAEDVVRQVNDWASEHTDGMIPEFLTEGPDEALRLILLNALALDADWQTQFDANDTADGTFHAEGGDVTVPFMHRDGAIEYAAAQGAQAVRLPYEDSALSMTVILPAQGELDKVLELLGSEGLGWLGGFEAQGVVNLSLPKLSMESSLDMKRLLLAAGISAPFAGDADFSGITGRDELFIDAILQKVRLDVDEQGTRAAAVTGIMMDGKGLILDPIEVNVDRPYILLIEDAGAGQTLFVAVVTNPSIA